MAMMADSGWVIFGAAFGGAVVGGLASTVGAAILARTAGNRDSRYRIFTSDIPKLRTQVDRYVPADGVWTAPALMDLQRNRVLVTKKERRLIDNVSTAWFSWVAWMEPDPQSERQTRRAKLVSEIQALEDYVNTKLVGRCG
jgi:hypothetical protein